MISELLSHWARHKSKTSFLYEYRYQGNGFPSDDPHRYWAPSSNLLYKLEKDCMLKYLDYYFWMVCNIITSLMKILDKRQLFFGRTMLLLSRMSVLCSLGRHESKILILCKTALSPIWHGCCYMFSTNDWCDKLHMLKGGWGKSFFFFPRWKKYVTVVHKHSLQSFSVSSAVITYLKIRLGCGTRKIS